jgi:hypothetical protein
MATEDTGRTTTMSPLSQSVIIPIPILEPPAPVPAPVPAHEHRNGTTGNFRNNSGYSAALYTGH